LRASDGAVGPTPVKGQLSAVPDDEERLDTLLLALPVSWRGHADPHALVVSTACIPARSMSASSTTSTARCPHCCGCLSSGCVSSATPRVKPLWDIWRNRGRGRSRRGRASIVRLSRGSYVTEMACNNTRTISAPDLRISVHENTWVLGHDTQNDAYNRHRRAPSFFQGPAGARSNSAPPPQRARRATGWHGLSYEGAVSRGPLARSRAAPALACRSRARFRGGRVGVGGSAQARDAESRLGVPDRA
jgi:hypothetical protein